MRIAPVLIVIALFASYVLARVGEAPEEATKRYGLPHESRPGTYSNTSTRIYIKDGIRIDATFMMSKSGKSIIGEIKYLLPKEMTQSNEVAKAVMTQLLEVNSGGQVWEFKRNLPTIQDYSRPDAVASMSPTRLTITLNEYTDYITAEKSRIGAEQASKIDKNIKEF